LTQIRKPHLIERSSPQPPVISSSNIQQFYARGPYGSRTTSRYPSLSFWCPPLLRGLDWFSWGSMSILFPLFCGLGFDFNYFWCEGFPGQNFHVVFLSFCSILKEYW
jgi:hypothetical protein